MTMNEQPVTRDQVNVGDIIRFPLSTMQYRSWWCVVAIRRGGSVPGTDPELDHFTMVNGSGETSDMFTINRHTRIVRRTV